MTDPVLGPETPPAKEDPQGFVLRGRPHPAVRFRRGLILAVCGILASALIAISWLALQPPSFRKAASSLESEPANRAGADALANAPKDYGDVPRLGPPLPGDLGRPILEHERSLEASAGADRAGPSENAARARAAAEAKRQHGIAAKAAARTSPVMVELAQAGGPGAAAQPSSPALSEAAVPNAGSEAAVPGNQQHKIEFARVGSESDINPHELMPAPSPWTLSAGTVIPASLLTGLNSDLPGTVLAQVTQNVHDSATGQTILIPQGARLIGRYDSVIAYGQRRALLVWTRIILPDGSSVRLDNLPATDTRGFAGLEDKVDSHTWALIKGIALSTLLGVGTQLSLGSSQSDLVRALRESAQQNAAHAGDQITSRNLDIQPTIMVRPGWPVRAIVNKDLVLQPWRG